MASLIIQDSFEPYYAGRDKEPAAQPSARGKRVERLPHNEIVLPLDAPQPAGTMRRDSRRDRRPVAH